MSKGSLLCLLLVVLQVCIAAQLPLISSSQLTGDNLLRRDPIRREWLMSSHGRDKFDGHSADSIFDEGVSTGDEYETNDGGMLLATGEAGALEEEEGSLLLHADDDGGGSSRTKDSSSGSGGGDVECPECGKFFKNDKSMFGHLRSHPNRGYKGATPPVKKLKLSPDTAAAAAASSSSPPPGTDRPPAQHSGRDPRLTPLEILCAYVILSLRFSGNNQAVQPVPPPPPPQPSFGKLDAIGQTEGGVGIRGSDTDNAAVAEFKCNAGVEAGNVGYLDEHGDSMMKIPKKRRNVPKEVREAPSRKKVKLVRTPKEKRPYACKHCKAEFPTNQALGGHVAGHHREKKVPRLYDSTGMAAESQNCELSMALDVPCQSGQAPVGHMRQHHERRNHMVSPAATAVTPAPDDDGDGRRLWNIDLNVEAPEQE